MHQKDINALFDLQHNVKECESVGRMTHVDGKVRATVNNTGVKFSTHIFNEMLALQMEHDKRSMRMLGVKEFEE
jgi:hypothetical protein